MKNNFNWDINELENLIVWERDLYIDLIINSAKENEQ